MLFALAFFAPADPGSVVRGYLLALQALDSMKMNQYLANPTANSDMRAFERGTHTKWTWKIHRIEGSEVVVDETESNAFYDALGVGKRFQTCVFTVRYGRIIRLDVSGMRHVRGNYRGAYAKFLEWLKSQPDANDPRLLQDGDLRFTAESARVMKPWLKRYVRSARKTG